MVIAQPDRHDQTRYDLSVDNRRLQPALADAETVTVPDSDKVVVLTQTTLSVDDTAKTIEILKRRFPELLVPSRDDLCYATKNRQDAVRRIASHVDLFLVVTSDYSSNGMRLLELAESLTGNARRIESHADIDPAWIVQALELTVALPSGTSVSGSRGARCACGSAGSTSSARDGRGCSDGSSW